MLDATDQTLYPLAELPARPFMPRRRGKTVHVATVYRWVTHGISGIKLETAKAGGGRFTTDAWAKAFIEALSAPKMGQQIRTPSRRRREVERAKAALAREGI